MKKTLLFAAAVLLGLGSFSANAEDVWVPQSRTGWTVTGCSQHGATGEGNDGGYAELMDGNNATFWHSEYNKTTQGHQNECPHYFVINRGENAGTIDGFGYQPRISDKGGNGYVTSYRLYVLDSIDGLNTAGSNAANGVAAITDNHASLTTFLEGKTPAKQGTFSFNNRDMSTHVLQQVAFDAAQTGRYVLFVIDGVNSSDANKHANCAEFYLYDIVSSDFTVTVNYVAEGNLVVKSESVAATEGAIYTPSVPAFCTTTSGAITLSASTPEVTIPVTINLPFKYTATTDNMIWQGIMQHSNQHWFWEYPADGSDQLINQTDYRVSATGFTDAQLWAFVGNLADGFKIYNKAAGSEQTLYKDGGVCKLGTATENNVWKVYASNAITNTTTACCFKTGDSEFINAQGNQLKFWGSADAGSTCQFFSPAAPLESYYNANLAFARVGVGVVSTPVEAIDLSAVNTAKNASVAEPYDVAKASAFATAIAALPEYSLVELDPNKWYRLENSAYANEFMTLGTDDNIYGGETSQRTNHNSVFTFEPVSGQDGQYYITSQGLYAGKVTQSTATKNTVASDDRGTFSLIHQGVGKYVFRDHQNTNNATYSYLHHANHNNGNNIVGWDNSADASKWYLHVATEVDMPLTQTYDTKYIGTGYFPFPVKAANGAKLYIISESTHKDTQAPVMVYNEIASAPARTAFVVMSENATATLTIDYEGAAAAAEAVNVLAGTLRNLSAEAGVYVLAGNEFVKSTEAPSIAGNSAWIPESAVKNATTQSYSLVDPSQTTTGIAEIGAAEGGKQVIYDLQGRRVQRAGKGLYIINGVKTLVK